jgi:hypothetical protein
MQCSPHQFHFAFIYVYSNLPSAQTAAARLIPAVREVGKNHTAEIIAIGVHYCFLKLQDIGGK